jgi:hypothetical protein
MTKEDLHLVSDLSVQILFLMIRSGTIPPTTTTLPDLAIQHASRLVVLMRNLEQSHSVTLQ